MTSESLVPHPFQCFGTIEHFLARMDMKIRPVRSEINFLSDFIGFKKNLWNKIKHKYQKNDDIGESGPPPFSKNQFLMKKKKINEKIGFWPKIQISLKKSVLGEISRFSRQCLQQIFSEKVK